MSSIPDRLASALADRYRLLRSLGCGGMSTVYLAEDLKHQRQVAVKVLRPELLYIAGSERFLQEIAIVANLTHPNILPLHDSGEAGGFVYYVMPFVAGESLEARLARRGRLPLDETMAIVGEVGDALDYAHEHGVVHRDIKPGNILLLSGHAVVTDFGAALAVQSDHPDRITEPGGYLGTPAYMSPEQATAQELDGRSDLYSLACVLFEMLAGDPPFTGPNPRVVITRHLSDAVPRLATLRADVPRGVERAVTRALAKEPADRFATVREFLEALLHDTAVEAPRKSIAVLPFSNMSTDPSDAFLSDGISEEIINALSHVEGLRVASRTSAFAFKESTADVRTIGQRLGVRWVLEGSVRRAGDRLRVTAQLVGVTDGYHLWSERFDRDMKDVFAIQDEIADSIARSLRGMLTASEQHRIRTPRTDDIEAYEHYLRGRQYFHEFRQKSLEAARARFRAALAIDTDYALAWTGLADTCSMLYLYWGQRAADLECADEASLHALELAPNLPQAHASRGLAVSLRKRFDEAAAEFKQAIRADPNLFEAYYFYARACFAQNKHEQAVRLFEKAAEVRDDYAAAFFAGQCYASLGRDEEAMVAYRRALTTVEAHLQLAPGDARAVTMGAVSHCRLGDRDAGLRWAERALAIDPEDAGVSYNVACLFALEGETDRAIACLEESMGRGFFHREWVENDPDLDSLRDDPRFQRLLESHDR